MRKGGESFVHIGYNSRNHSAGDISCVIFLIGRHQGSTQVDDVQEE